MLFVFVFHLNLFLFHIDLYMLFFLYPFEKTILVFCQGDKILASVPTQVVYHFPIAILRVFEVIHEEIKQIRQNV